MNPYAWRQAARTLLMKSAWFGALPEPLRAAILEHAELIRLDKDDFLFRAGDAADGFFGVLSGDLRAFRREAGGKEAFLEIYGPTSWVGVALWTGSCPKRDFSIVAAAPSQVLFLATKAYREIVAREPLYLECFGELVSSLAAEAQASLFEQRFDASRRTARILMRIADLHGRKSEKGVELHLALSQGDLASLAGVSRQYMNGLIKRWQRAGLISWTGESYPTIEPNRFKSLLAPADAVG
jgi:CRP-like cAMP-binding protein